MKTEKECLACFYKQIVRVSNVLNLSKEETKKLSKDFSNEFDNINMDETPAYNGRIIYDYLYKKTGIRDPYKEIKEKSIKEAKQYIEQLEEIIENANNRLKTSLIISAAGNMIDFGVDKIFSFNEILDSINHMHFALDDFDKFENEIEHAQTGIIIADNAGESVFDLFLLKELSKKIKMYYAVRSGPIINDITYNEAIMSGNDKYAEIIDSGCDAPGFIENEASENMKDILNKADIIISKGQGNFESLSGSALDIYFLLTIKCDIVAKYTHLHIGDKIFTKKRF